LEKNKLKRRESLGRRGVVVSGEYISESIPNSAQGEVPAPARARSPNKEEPSGQEEGKGVTLLWMERGENSENAWQRGGGKQDLPLAEGKRSWRKHAHALWKRKETARKMGGLGGRKRPIAQKGSGLTKETRKDIRLSEKVIEESAEEKVTATREGEVPSKKGMVSARGTLLHAKKIAGCGKWFARGKIQQVLRGGRITTDSLRKTPELCPPKRKIRQHDGEGRASCSWEG